MTVLDDIAEPLLPGMAEAATEVWDHLGRPGRWWTGPERIAVAEELIIAILALNGVGARASEDRIAPATAADEIVPALRKHHVIGRGSDEAVDPRRSDVRG